MAKARPGELNYAMGGTGSSSHLAAELFKSMAGVDIVRITYKGTAAALNDLIGGQVQMVFATAPSVAPQLKSGRLRALVATASLELGIDIGDVDLVCQIASPKSIATCSATSPNTAAVTPPATAELVATVRQSVHPSPSLWATKPIAVAISTSARGIWKGG